MGRILAFGVCVVICARVCWGGICGLKFLGRAFCGWGRFCESRFCMARFCITRFYANGGGGVSSIFKLAFALFSSLSLWEASPDSSVFSDLFSLGVSPCFTFDFLLFISVLYALFNAFFKFWLASFSHLLKAVALKFLVFYLKFVCMQIACFM